MDGAHQSLADVVTQALMLFVVSYKNCSFNLGFTFLAQYMLYPLQALTRHTWQRAFYQNSYRQTQMMHWHIVCDFDGTITRTDVIDTILERFADPSWEAVEDEWLSGKIGSR